MYLIRRIIGKVLYVIVATVTDFIVYTITRAVFKRKFFKNSGTF